VVSKVLLGGGVVREGLKNKLPQGIEFWEGFGMTETITHIAARRVISGESNPPFAALPGVNFRTGPDGTLVIHAPNRGVFELVTDDLVERIDGQNFRWLGRKSSVINSGGMKVIPEVVEREIRGIMRPLDCAYLIRGIADDGLGERVVLRLDSEKLNQEDEEELLRKIASLKTLPSYHNPRGIEYGAIKTSIVGKIQRI
jgi:O-succinylbenzoic acid--CoA ligase